MAKSVAGTSRSPSRREEWVEPELVEVEDRAAWRAWLERNHRTSGTIWLVIYKKEGRGNRLSYEEAVEEALCFGWIDSKANTLDERRYKQLFSLRKPGGTWARLNKERIERLIAEGLMTPAGLEVIEAAKRDGSWTSYDRVEAAEVPDDLQAALDANPTARDNFAAFNLTTRKALIWRVESAKRAETRARRIADVVQQAGENRPLGQ